MKRGIVMSIHKQHAVVLTADGSFLRAPIQGKTQIGEEVTFEEEYSSKFTFKKSYWYAGAAAFVLLLFIPLLILVQRDAHPIVAYISMDINPSVEIGVDAEEMVRELRALNTDGELVIKGIAYKGIRVEEVAAAIVERASSSHYLDKKDKDIFITSMLLESGTAIKLDYEAIIAEKVDESLRVLFSKLETEASSANVTTLSVPNELWQEAEANGISSGKMAVYLMAKDEGYQLELEEMKQKSIDSVTESIGGVKKIVNEGTDTSKKKLVELVQREQKEKEKQQKQNEKVASVKPTGKPVVSKPVKTTKPEKTTKPIHTTKPKHTEKPKKTESPASTWKDDMKNYKKPWKEWNGPTSSIKPNGNKNDDYKYENGHNGKWNHKDNDDEDDDDNNDDRDNKNKNNSNSNNHDNKKDRDKDNKNNKNNERNDGDDKDKNDYRDQDKKRNKQNNENDKNQQNDHDERWKR